MNLFTTPTNMEPKNRTDPIRKYDKSILLRDEMKKNAPASAMKKKNIKTHMIASHFPTNPPGILFLKEAATIMFANIIIAPSTTRM